MSEFVYKERTQRNLPHLQPPDATLFVTFRLADTIPKPVLDVYHNEKKWFDQEIKRLSSVKLENDSPEVKAHLLSLREFHSRWFVKFEDILHKAEIGPTWLKEDQIARLVADALHYRDDKVFRLDAYCIMSNHVHAVFAPLDRGRSPRNQIAW